MSRVSAEKINPLSLPVYFVPRLQTLNLGQDFSVPFLRRLYQEKDSFVPSSALSSVLSQLVTCLLHNAPPFSVKEIRPGNSSSQDPDIDSSMELIKLAVDTANVDSCSAVFISMRAVPRDGPLKHIIPRFYSGMTARLDKYLTVEVQDLSVFREFFRDAVVLLLENLPPSIFYHTAANDVKMLTIAVKWAGGVSFLKEM